MIDDSTEIAAMIGAFLLAVIRSRGLRGLIVVQIAIRKPVRHDHIDHVVGRNPLKAPPRVGAGQQGKTGGDSAGFSAYRQENCARARTGSDLQPNKEVVCTSTWLCADDSYPWIVAGHFGLVQTVAGNE